MWCQVTQQWFLIKWQFALSKISLVSSWIQHLSGKTTDKLSKMKVAYRVHFLCFLGLDTIYLSIFLWVEIAEKTGKKTLKYHVFGQSCRHLPNDVKTRKYCVFWTKHLSLDLINVSLSSLFSRAKIRPPAQFFREEIARAGQKIYLFYLNAWFGVHFAFCAKTTSFLIRSEIPYRPSYFQQFSRFELFYFRQSRSFLYLNSILYNFPLEIKKTFCENVIANLLYIQVIHMMRCSSPKNLH